MCRRKLPDVGEDRRRGGPRAAACTSRDIAQYPTWIIDGRRFQGVLPPEELARYSGFEWERGE